MERERGGEREGRERRGRENGERERGGEIEGRGREEGRENGERERGGEIEGRGRECMWGRKLEYKARMSRAGLKIELKDKIAMILSRTPITKPFSQT